MQATPLFNAAAALALLVLGAHAQPVLQPKAGDPLAGLSAAQLAAFDTGKEQFDRVFTIAEGLGPIFNQNSCASCHSNPVGGSGTILVTRFGILNGEANTFDSL